MNRVRFDMHCHTAEGSPDAKVKILDYIDLLKQRGFHGMLVTDHDSYSGYKAYLRQKDKVKDFTVLRGTSAAVYLAQLIHLARSS